MASRIEVEGLDEIIDGLDELLKAVHPRTILSLIGDSHLDWIDRNFEQEGIEEKWPPLSPNTIAGRRGGSSKPLQDTGRLKQSFTKHVFGGSVDVGTRDPRGEIHHGGVPASKFAGKLLPKSKKALSFLTADGRVTVREVKNHPGIPRRPLVPTKALAEKLASRTAQAMLDKVTKENF